MGKAAGGSSSLYLSECRAWQMKGAPPGRQAVNVGHRAARLDGIIHRYLFNIDKSFKVHVVYSSDFRWIGKTILP